MQPLFQVEKNRRPAPPSVRVCRLAFWNAAGATRVVQPSRGRPVVGEGGRRMLPLRAASTVLAALATSPAGETW
jgi:hypothetical protein